MTRLHTARYIFVILLLAFAVCLSMLARKFPREKD